MNFPNDHSLGLAEGTSLTASLSVGLDRIGYHFLRRCTASANLVDSQSGTDLGSVGGFTAMEVDLLSAEDWAPAFEELDEDDTELIALIESVEQVLAATGACTVILIDGFELSPRWRGRGIGCRLLAQALHYWSQQAHDTYVVLRIGPAGSEVTSTEVRAQAIERLRMAAKVLGFSDVDDTPEISNVMLLNARYFDASSNHLMIGWLN